MNLYQSFPAEKAKTPFCESLTDNLSALGVLFSDSFDFKIRRLSLGSIRAALICLDGMCNNAEIFQSVTLPLTQEYPAGESAPAFYERVRDRISANVQQSEVFFVEDASAAVIAGNLLLLVDGVARSLVFGVQGYPKHAISDPQSDMQDQGSHDGFTDSFKDNATLVRRHLATDRLCIKNRLIGQTGKTNVLVCYLKDRASAEMVAEVFRRLDSVQLDLVPGSGCLSSFLEPAGWRVFPTVGSTERPDVFCAKLAEGKIGVIVDGTPHALLIPFLFIENFHTLDDYLKRPYYAFFLRVMKAVAFLVAVFLPGLYAAVLLFHPEILPDSVLGHIVSSQRQTPFPVLVESLVIHIIYEVVREAGLRMPKSVGHTISIVGALIIGDAAVSAHLISAPMLIIVALTAVSSAVVSDIQDPVSVLRLVFIVIGGVFGIFGIFLGAGALLLNFCAQRPYGIPYTLPFAPLRMTALKRDAVMRRDWKFLQKKQYDPALAGEEGEQEHEKGSV